MIIFGLGNVGTLVAQRSTSLNFTDSKCNVTQHNFFHHVYGTSRSAKEIKGVETVDFGAHEKLKKILPSCTHVLVTIPPVEPPPSSTVGNNTNTTHLVGGRPRQWKYFCDPVLNNPNYSIEDLLPANTWVGYISSTSVYGNHDGGWVTEESEVKCKPGSKGELYFRAENEWRNASEKCNWRLNVFRASGLYGDGRSAMHTIRKRGAITTILDLSGDDIEPKQKIPSKDFPTSRIHEEDVSRAILSAMMCNEQPTLGGSCLWNLADDNPAPRTEVMAFATKLLDEADLIPPKKDGDIKSSNAIMPQQQSERARRRKTDRKRVSNQRMKDLLLPDGKLLYPTYQEGLRSVLDSNKKVWSTKVSSKS